MVQAQSGLWVPHAVPLLTHRATKRTVTLPNGERALVTVDDSRTVKHIEHGDQLDAVVRPRTVTIRIRKGGTLNVANR
jgi:hypothetical protein